MIIFPDLASLQAKFPYIDPNILKDDLAYPAMLTFLPVGVMGIVVASLIAAYMSTMASQLNWGSSYLVNDFYKRFLKPGATDKELVRAGRISTVVLMLVAGTLALFLQNALQAFHILLQIGAGTGLIFILRWFWWRINAFTELSGMIISFFVAIYFEMIHPKLNLLPMESHERLIVGVLLTTAGWLIVTFLTKPTDNETLVKFYKLIRPGGRGWDKVIQLSKSTDSPITETAKKGDLALGLILMIAGTFAVYGAVFASGFYLYGEYTSGAISTVVTAVSVWVMIKNWGKIEMD
jgi:Na+/proline symporter